MGQEQFNMAGTKDPNSGRTDNQRLSSPRKNTYKFVEVDK